MSLDVGDYVGIESGRDKIRYGRIEKIVPGAPFPYTVKIDDSTSIYCKKESLITKHPIQLNNIIPNGAFSLPNLPPIVAIKHDTSKNRLELIPPEAIEAMGRAFTYGASKYSDHNWTNGFDWERLIGSAFRHFNDFRQGIDIDEESGLHQLDCLIANIAMLITHVEKGLGNDNRRKLNKKAGDKL